MQVGVKRIEVLLISLLLCWWGVRTNADEMILKDGKSLRGEAKSQEKMVVLKTRYGILNVPWEDIERLNYVPAQDVVLVLTDGSKVQGKLAGETEEAYEIIREKTTEVIEREKVAEVKFIGTVLAEEKENIKRLVERLEADARRLEKAGLVEEWKKVLRALNQLDETNDYAGENLGMIKVGGVWVEYPYPYESVDFYGKRGWLVKAQPFLIRTDVGLKEAAEAARGLLWLLPRLKKVFVLEEVEIPVIEIHIFSSEESYRGAMKEEKKGHYSYEEHKLYLVQGNDLLVELFGNIAFCFVDRVLGLGPRWEGDVLKDSGAPQWLVFGLALYLRGWEVPYRKGEESSAEDSQNLGVAEDFLKEVAGDLRDGTYCEPRALTRIPVRAFEKKVYWYAWSVVTTILHRKDFADGYKRMWDALKSGKRHPSDYFDPFFEQEKLKRAMLQNLVRLARFRGQVAANGRYGVTYLWHEEGLKLLEGRQLKAAIAKYNSIVEIAPKDYVALYNLACAYSLLGDKQNGAMYLLKAYDAGFRDIEHIKKDSDLENIRDTDIYKSIVGGKKEF
ncbi:MAG: hypothetical protein N2234_10185 [Planctomycetota bacterium]|nr:hypothetical protein [Planctomycetota bacterium]